MNLVQYYVPDNTLHLKYTSLIKVTKKNRWNICHTL